MTDDPARTLQIAEAVSRHAVAVQDHPGFQQALKRLEAHYVDLFRASLPEDAAGRDSAYFMLRALDALRQDIASAAVGGAITSRNLRSRTR
jgi:hypothetical protein